MDLYKTSQTKNFLSSALSEGRWSAGLKPYITFKCLQIFKDLFFQTDPSLFGLVEIK